MPPLEKVASGPGLGTLAHLRFFDPDHLRAGNIHNKLSLWQDLLEKSPCFEDDFLEVIRDGVRVDPFFISSSSHSEGISKDRRITPNVPHLLSLKNYRIGKL